jgi:hypothetical protein
MCPIQSLMQQQILDNMSLNVEFSTVCVEDCGISNGWKLLDLLILVVLVQGSSSFARTIFI